MSDKKHHWLITAQITYELPNSDGTVHATMQNGVLLTEEHCIASKDIGKAQQIVQMVMHRQMKDDVKPNVIDVTIIGFSYLGQMTQEYFSASPKGMKMQEKQNTFDDTTH